MKTKDQLLADIQKLEAELKTFLPSKKSKVDPDIQLEKFAKKLNKRVGFIRECILYIETEPRESFLQTQLDGLNSKLRAIAKLIKEVKYKKEKGEKEKIAEIKKERSFNKFEAQRKTLQFILY